MYAVIGGEYKDTTFISCIHGTEVHQTFDSYDEAYKFWQAESWKQVDKCHFRVIIKQLDN